MKEDRLNVWDPAILKRGDVVFTYLLRLLFIVAFIISVVRGNWSLVAVSIASLALTFIPSILAHSIHVSLPASFQIVLLIFIFGAQFLGEIFDFYERFWWWDLVLHGWSGILLGTIGFLLVFILNEASGVRIVMSPFFVAFFALCFAVTCGVVWEVFEYLMDVIFGTNMQKSGLHDTMGDLIIDSAGALIVAINGYFSLKDNRMSRMQEAITEFMTRNPALEKRIDDQLSVGKRRKDQKNI